LPVHGWQSSEVIKASIHRDPLACVTLGIRAAAGRSKLRRTKAVASYRTPRPPFGVRKLAAAPPEIASVRSGRGELLADVTGNLRHYATGRMMRARGK